MTDDMERLAQTTPELSVEIDAASLEPARRISGVLFSELGDPNSVVHQMVAIRHAAMSPEARLGIAPALLVDPTRSTWLERWRLQPGNIAPNDADDNPEKAVLLWSALDRGEVPPLRVPEHLNEPVMELADRLQMRGGGPDIFAREEVADLRTTPNTLIHVAGGANFAMQERLQTALAVVEAHGQSRPILATVDPGRVLQGPEREKVAGFAEGAQNEMDLFMASAMAKGFESVVHPVFGGTRFLPDGSSYSTMQHRETGADLIVLAPAKTGDTAVINTYRTLVNHGDALFGEDFSFTGSDIVQVTSTHYGTMAIMNNLRAVHELRETIGSFQVAGDNQPATRTPQAHFIEVGLTVGALGKVAETPALIERLAA